MLMIGSMMRLIYWSESECAHELHKHHNSLIVDDDAVDHHDMEFMDYLEDY